VFVGDPRQQNLQDPQSLNSYSYAGGNPISSKDPSGKSLSYVTAGVAAFDATVVWDFGRDVASNVQNVNVPWYQKLTLQDPDAPLRYNSDAYGNAATAIAVVATAGRLSPLVAAEVLTQGGANVISASVAGLGNVVNSYIRGDLKSDDSYTAGQKAMMSFESGFLGARTGQRIPNSSGAEPSTLFSAVSSAHGLTEQYRAHVDQATEAAFQGLFSSKVLGTSGNFQGSSPSSNAPEQLSKKNSN
jgi:hypothetical protein